MLSVLVHLQLWLVLLFHLAHGQCTVEPSVTITGRLLCHGEAMPLTSFVLEHRILFIDNELAIGATKEDGSFEITGRPVYEVKQQRVLVLRLRYGHQSSWSSFRVTRGRDVIVDQGASIIQMGNVNVEDHMCKAYTAFYKAAGDYYERVGDKVPFRFLIKPAPPGSSRVTPYVLYTDVVSPTKFDWTPEDAQHELAHVIRHFYDGDLAHFRDVVSKYYSEDYSLHDCSTGTNEGFAFNEGWAFYWQGACMEGNALESHQISGNVAAALRDLQARCGSSDKQMWRVLKKSPGSIHSFAEYEARHAEIHGCS